MLMAMYVSLKLKSKHTSIHEPYQVGRICRTFVDEKSSVMRQLRGHLVKGTTEILNVTHSEYSATWSYIRVIANSLFRTMQLFLLPVDPHFNCAHLQSVWQQ